MNTQSNLMFIGIAIGIVSIAGAWIYGTQTSLDRIPDSVVPAHANLEGSYTSSSGLGAEINKERWHEDPFGDIAAEVKAKFESGG